MDASCFCYQFFHAASRKLSSVGRSTAVEHLFLKRVLDVISGQQILGFGRASQLIVVFDSPPASTGGGQPLRRSMYPEYKVPTAPQYPWHCCHYTVAMTLDKHTVASK